MSSGKQADQKWAQDENPRTVVLWQSDVAAEYFIHNFWNLLAKIIVSTFLQMAKETRKQPGSDIIAASL
jgi:hypothetical protein